MELFDFLCVISCRVQVENGSAMCDVVHVFGTPGLLSKIGAPLHTDCACVCVDNSQPE